MDSYKDGIKIRVEKGGLWNTFSWISI